MTVAPRRPAPRPLRYAMRECHGVQVLACDDTPDGRIVEVLGDLATADHVAVIVPGNGHHLGNYFASPGPVAPRNRGQSLLRTMQALDPDARSAVVVWVGYEAPSGLVTAVVNGPAHNGAGDLTELTHELPRSAQVTLVGHSYGATVCALALDGARVDDCVLLGAPGLGVSRREQLRYPGRLWAAMARADWIRFTPDIMVGGFGLGRGPLDPRIGATAIETGDISGHCGYYREDSESLLNIARIALGRHEDVTLAGHPRPAVAARTPTPTQRRTEVAA